LTIPTSTGNQAEVPRAKRKCHVHCGQGDQIGRISATWATFYFLHTLASLLKTTEVAQFFG
jgi:hypothetical protein